MKDTYRIDPVHIAGLRRRCIFIPLVFSLVIGMTYLLSVGFEHSSHILIALILAIIAGGFSAIIPFSLYRRQSAFAAAHSLTISGDLIVSVDHGTKTVIDPALIETVYLNYRFGRLKSITWRRGAHIDQLPHYADRAALIKDLERLLGREKIQKRHFIHKL